MRPVLFVHYGYRWFLLEQLISMMLLAVLAVLKFSPTVQLATALLVSACALNFAGFAPYRLRRDNHIEATGNWICT